ncbi:DNA/RNA non-specific endonuclease [Enorma burkinafasonensis]|uniref:DNA/RNA non-specific endonuclease n=1 Tax=Enorma burkinafasonensis TaxID=2590867 RepID=UPI00119DB5DF|nr:DNA/RNA non-specific endonuclease [Enorma burkinafasonensis]
MTRTLSRLLRHRSPIIALLLALAIAPACAGCGLLDGGRAPRESAASIATVEDAQEIAEDEAPAFTEEDLAYAEENLGYEEYSDLDGLGRCGTASACLGPETMPERNEERESIYEIRPSGWQSARYDSVEGESLYNRCHLIAWSLSAENANAENLVTGTRWMNAEEMLPVEEEVARYIDRTGNHVLYRSTPIFEGDELVCRGVLIEARSIEDDGSGIYLAVWCPNVQPGIAIDYEDGDNWLDDSGSSGSDGSQAAGGSSASQGQATMQDYVLNTSSMRFHRPDCPSVQDTAAHNRETFHGTRDELIELGYEPCGSCNP